ncbi:hypothetical protein ACWKSP_39055 [Micromonosporaceae bacterium Da 78-11]
MSERTDVVVLVRRYGPDDFLVGEWEVPHSVVFAIGELVRATEDGLIDGEWVITTEMVGAVQPFVPATIEPATKDWFIGTYAA